MAWTDEQAAEFEDSAFAAQLALLKAIEQCADNDFGEKARDFAEAFAWLRVPNQAH